MTATAWLFVVGGAILVGIGGYFLVARPALLAEDLRYLHRSEGVIERVCCTIR